MTPEDTLYVILPLCVENGKVEFRDFTRQCEVQTVDEYTLQIEGEFPEGLVRFDVELQPGRLDYETLYEELSEYLSGEYRKIGPLDLAFTMPPHMAVPMLAVALDGELFGKMWFELPSVEDLRQRKLGGVFALEFPGGKRHTVTISVEEGDRYRLDLSMLERIRVRRDSRQRMEVQPREDLNRGQPWLFLQGHTVEELRGWREATHAELWEEMRATVAGWLETGETPTRGFPNLATLAFMALLEAEEVPASPPAPSPGRGGGTTSGERQVASHLASTPGEASSAPTRNGAEGALVELLERMKAEEGFLRYPGCKFMFLRAEEGLFTEEHRWLMGYGWNDYGFSWILLDYCTVYQWLGERLPGNLRTWVAENLRKYGRELYRFILFQRQYGGGKGYYESHSIVPILAVAALGVTFWEEWPEARDWASFAFGRLEEALDLAPEDGRPDYLSWGPPWFVQAVELLRDFSGRDERDRPYFQEMATALWRCREGGGYHGLLLAAYAASRLGDPTGQWYYQACRDRRRANPAAGPMASYLSFLWHSTEPGEDPGAVKDQSYWFRDTGRVILQTNYDRPRLALELQCGPPNGHAAAYRAESYANAVSMGPTHHGSFQVSVRGQRVVRDPGALSYRRRLGNSNLVCVDEDGYYLDGLYLIGRTEARYGFIRRCELEGEVQYVEGCNTAVYAPELQIQRSRRQWYFDPVHEWAAVVDEIESARDHAYRLHLHGEIIEQPAAGEFIFRAGDQALNVKVLAGQETAYSVVPPTLVLSYVFNCTQVKSGKHLSGDAGMERNRPPQIDRLVCAAVGNRKAARWITVMSPHPLECRLAGEELVVRTARGEHRVRVD
ncbi:MAG: hypothetical protein GX100_09460 [candidate division WS1 bacterium]|nr:hypothetical protein [candidate division WS1 bacterium]